MAPTPDELRRLDARNEAIMASPHPLKRSLELVVRQGCGGSTRQARREFLKAVDDAAPWSA